MGGDGPRPFLCLQLHFLFVSSAVFVSEGVFFQVLALSFEMNVFLLFLGAFLIH